MRRDNCTRSTAAFSPPRATPQQGGYLTVISTFRRAKPHTMIRTHAAIPRKAPVRAVQHTNSLHNILCERHLISRTPEHFVSQINPPYSLITCRLLSEQKDRWRSDQTPSLLTTSTEKTPAAERFAAMFLSTKADDSCRPLVPRSNFTRPGRQRHVPKYPSTSPILSHLATPPPGTVEESTRRCAKKRRNAARCNTSPAPPFLPNRDTSA